VADGGEGFDHLDVSLDGRSAAVDLDLSTGQTPTGLSFMNIEEIAVTVSGANDNSLYGFEGRDIFQTGSGADFLVGRAGDDFLNANAGDDRLDGGEGNDRLDGGEGADELIGGAGADSFVWDILAPDGTGIDTVRDFSGAEGDVLEFSYIAQNSTGIDDFDSFVTASRDTDAGLFVSFNGATDHGILLEGVTLSDISPDSVVFGDI